MIGSIASVRRLREGIGKVIQPPKSALATWARTPRVVAKLARGCTFGLSLSRNTKPSRSRIARPNQRCPCCATQLRAAGRRRTQVVSAVNCVHNPCDDADNPTGIGGRRGRDGWRCWRLPRAVPIVWVCAGKLVILRRLAVRSTLLHPWHSWHSHLRIPRLPAPGSLRPA